MLSETRLAPHFEVTAPIRHFGLFRCGPAPVAGVAAPGRGRAVVLEQEEGGLRLAGHGDAQGAAALASTPGTSQATTAAALAPPTAGNATPALPSVTPKPGTPTSAAPMGGGPLSSTQGEAILQDGGILQRLAGRAAGIDTDRGGMAQKYFQQASNPVLKSLRELMAFVPGGGSNGDVDLTNVGNVMEQVAKMFVTPGVDASGWARQQAQQIAANPEFLNRLGGAGSAEQENALQALLGFRGAGASGLKASAMDQQYRRGMGQYQDQEMGLLPGSTLGQYRGNVANFFATPEGQKFASVFGILPK